MKLGVIVTVSFLNVTLARTNTERRRMVSAALVGPGHGLVLGVCPAAQLCVVWPVDLHRREVVPGLGHGVVGDPGSLRELLSG